MPTPRYEREIRSLLNKLPDFLPDTPAAPSTPRPHAPPGRRWLASQTWLLRDAYGMAALLVILAKVGRGLLGGPGAQLLAWIAVALLVVAIVAGIVRGIRQRQPRQTWRGRTIFETRSTIGASPWSWLRRWFGNGPGRGGSPFGSRWPR